MSTALAESVMSKEKTTMTRIGESALEEARLAATFVGMSLVEYLTDRVLKAAKADIDEGIARRQQTEKPKPKR